MEIKRWCLLVSGHVQGVYYRASTQARAVELGLTGYARNLPDGRVEVVAEGTEDKLAQLKTWCDDGPPAANVDSVNVSEQTPAGGFTGFSIRG
ncbi:acylphosphatase [Marinobacter antarcticus]|uniref:acylphosphatase n=1 Tax=Marinobacter antarcticus TaxID=564117 RepID=A0A1M6Q2V2_9GAMM|nr:acylphosphatase [Marinobacter antarcticus]SHK14545.1 acylphosphatase [Marinobacter antarcticus]